MWTAWLLAGLGVLGSGLVQDPPPTVRGIVVDAQSGVALFDAHVEIIELHLETQTDVTGHFEFPRVAPGAYTVTISTVGYIFVRRRVDVPAAGLTLTVPLATGTGTYEENVRVTPEPSAQPAAGQVRELGSGDIQNLRGVVADDPVRAVQALPGVATGDDFQAEFSVRGSAFRHLGLVTDDVATPLLFHAVRGTEDTGSVAMINSDVLARASLAIGPRAAEDGDWLGATLSFDVREGSRDRLAVRAAVSGTNASTVAEGPIGRSKRGSWLFSFRQSYVDWLIRKIDPSIEGTIGFVDAETKVAYDLTPRHHLELLILGGDTTYRKPSAVAANEIQRATSSSLLTSLLWRFAWNRGLVKQRLSLIDSRFRDRGLLRQEQARGDTRVIVWRGDIAVPLRSWSFDSGLSWQRERTAVVLRDFTTVSSTSVRLRSEQALSDIRAIASAWAQVGGRAKGVGLTAGTRVTGDSLTDVLTALPWLLVERRVKHLEFTAGASRAVQFATIDRVAQAAPGTTLAPERAWLLDAGVRLALTTHFFLSSTVFRRGETDVNRRVNEDKLVNGVRVVQSTFPTYASRLDGTSHGVDIVVERRSDRGPTGWMGYTWAHTGHNDAVTHESFDGDFDQRHTFNAFAEQRLSYRLKVSAKFRYGSNFPIVGYFTGSNDDLHLGSVRNAVRLPPYARLDLSGSRAFSFTRSRLTLFVELVNVTGRRNYGPSDGAIRSNGQAIDFSERLIPFLPSAGMLVEF